MSDVSSLLKSLEKANYDSISLKEKDIKDFEYLFHHVTVDKDGVETLHHCYVYDHIANMFVQNHLVVRDGKAFLNGKLVKNETFHVLVGLEPSQQVVWSDDAAVKSKIRPKKMVAGMTLKAKEKEW